MYRQRHGPVWLRDKDGRLFRGSMRRVPGGQVKQSNQAVGETRPLKKADGER